MILSLTELGCRRVTLVVRDPARADATLAAVARHPRPPEVAVTTFADPHGCDDADAVVSTIPADAQTPEVVELASGAPVVFDVVYDPWPTPLVTAATSAGRILVTGLDLLLWQAVDQVRAMTGRFDVPVDTMREAGSRALSTP
jgi:shikimate dehydrogenase